MRDVERQNRFGNSFHVKYPDFPAFTVPPRSITLIQEMGKHDIVEIRYPRFTAALVKSITTGVPVEVTWKNDKLSGKFVGYAVEVSYPTIQKLERGIRILCIGASYPLKERSSKIWKNKTASDIVVDIAKKFKLKPVVTPSNVRFTQQSLAGHSYWEKLNELASRIGYGIQVIGTELHFHPIDTMINQFMTTIPVMAFKNPLQNPSSTYKAPTLDVFEPRIGDFIESADFERTANTISGVDPTTGKVYKAQDSSSNTNKSLRKSNKASLFSSVETRTVSESNAMAKSLSKGRAQLGRLTVPATGIGQGDPRIAPWRTVEVRGTGEASDGFWIVKKVEHYIHIDGRYQVEFTVLTDGVGKNKPSAFRPSSSGTIPIRPVTAELAAAKKKKPTSSKLSAPVSMVKQSSTGYKVTPRRWKGK